MFISLERERRSEGLDARSSGAVCNAIPDARAVLTVIEGIAPKGASPPFDGNYSERSASAGSTRAARRAGP